MNKDIRYCRKMLRHLFGIYTKKVIQRPKHYNNEYYVACETKGDYYFYEDAKLYTGKELQNLLKNKLKNEV